MGRSLRSKTLVFNNLLRPILMETLKSFRENKIKYYDSLQNKTK